MLFRSQSRARGQTIVLDLDDDLPPVEVDSIRIKQALTNVISNAIKYAPDGSRIRISTQAIGDVRALPASAPRDVMLPGILIGVQDDGPGLSPEDAEMIFLPFYRTSSAKARKVEGYGLGLAIAQSLIEAHRGKIWAVPVPPASGGCFRLTIPVAR